ncbi:unnamed protein product [Protopolystoma xenopodis]|uniref:Uncharacterized protein n=1 Tax=Protopolystoma xenopodis TaxID=117903 RepID=A0A448WTH8_9PLAT|nr:unnamed protein product [Protopolystoma xenopodis]
MNRLSPSFCSFETVFSACLQAFMSLSSVFTNTRTHLFCAFSRSTKYFITSRRSCLHVTVVEVLAHLHLTTLFSSAIRQLQFDLTSFRVITFRTPFVQFPLLGLSLSRAGWHSGTGVIFCSTVSLQPLELAGFFTCLVVVTT